MKSAPILERLARNRAEALQPEVSRAERRVVEADQTLAAYRARMADERVRAESDPLGGMGMMSFLAWIELARAEEQRLEAERDRLAQEAAKLRVVLVEHFAEAKKFEFVKDQAKLRRETELAVREQAMLDEAGLRQKEG